MRLVTDINETIKKVESEVYLMRKRIEDADCAWCNDEDVDFSSLHSQCEDVENATTILIDLIEELINEVNDKVKEFEELMRGF